MVSIQLPGCSERRRGLISGVVIEGYVLRLHVVAAEAEGGRCPLATRNLRAASVNEFSEDSHGCGAGGFRDQTDGFKDKY